MPPKGHISNYHCHPSDDKVISALQFYMHSTFQENLPLLQNTFFPDWRYLTRIGPRPALNAVVLDSKIAPLKNHVCQKSCTESGGSSPSQLWRCLSVDDRQRFHILMKLASFLLPGSCRSHFNTKQKRIPIYNICTVLDKHGLAVTGWG